VVKDRKHWKIGQDPKKVNQIKKVIKFSDSLNLLINAPKIGFDHVKFNIYLN